MDFTSTLLFSIQISFFFHIHKCIMSFNKKQPLIVSQWLSDQFFTNMVPLHMQISGINLFGYVKEFQIIKNLQSY